VSCEAHKYARGSGKILDITAVSRSHMCIYSWARLLAATTKLHSGETIHLIIFYFRW